MSKVMQLPMQLSRRPSSYHKGDCGHVLIIGGSKQFPGAPFLSGLAALRSGAGLVSVAVADCLTGFKDKALELMIVSLDQNKSGSIKRSATKQIRKILKSRKIDVVALGPGLSLTEDTKQFVFDCIAFIEQPLLLDADALNCLACDMRKLKKVKSSSLIITPHTGEMARLMKTSVDSVQRDRKKIAKLFAHVYNCTVVLKGKNTIVAGTDSRIFINSTGNSDMATAGTGDCLTGIIASFIGQKVDVFKSCCAGVYVHGKAGDMAHARFGPVSLIASDIIQYLPQAIKSCL